MDDIDARIVGVGDADSHVDSYVEEKRAEDWETVDSDERASQIYATAFLRARDCLDRLYDRDMGNLSLKDGVGALTQAAKFLGKDED